MAVCKKELEYLSFLMVEELPSFVYKDNENADDVGLAVLEGRFYSDNAIFMRVKDGHWLCVLPVHRVDQVHHPVNQHDYIYLGTMCLRSSAGTLVSEWIDAAAKYMFFYQDFDARWEFFARTDDKWERGIFREYHELLSTGKFFSDHQFRRSIEIKERVDGKHYSEACVMANVLDPRVKFDHSYIRPLWRSVVHREPRSRLVVAVPDCLPGRAPIIGYAAVVSVRGEYNDLVSIAVEPDFQRQGIGRRLFLGAMKLCDKRLPLYCHLPDNMQFMPSFDFVSNIFQEHGGAFEVLPKGETPYPMAKEPYDGEVLRFHTSWTKLKS